MKAQGLRKNLPEISQACSLFFFISIQASDNGGGFEILWGGRSIFRCLIQPLKVKIINFLPQRDLFHCWTAEKFYLSHSSFLHFNSIKRYYLCYMMMSLSVCRNVLEIFRGAEMNGRFLRHIFRKRTGFHNVERLSLR
jgi:hypothetical protein